MYKQTVFTLHKFDATCKCQAEEAGGHNTETPVPFKSLTTMYTLSVRIYSSAVIKWSNLYPKQAGSVFIWAVRPWLHCNIRCCVSSVWEQSGSPQCTVALAHAHTAQNTLLVASVLSEELANDISPQTEAHDNKFGLGVRLFDEAHHRCKFPCTTCGEKQKQQNIKHQMKLTTHQM